MSIPSHPQEHDMNMNMNMNMGSDRGVIAEFIPGQQHLQVQCKECKFIPDDTLEPEQVMDALLTDMEHWAIDMPDQKLSNFGAKAWLHVNRVVTGRALTGDLAQIENIAGYCMGTAKNYVKEIEKLRYRR